MANLQFVNMVFYENTYLKPFHPSFSCHNFTYTHPLLLQEHLDHPQPLAPTLRIRASRLLQTLSYRNTRILSIHICSEDIKLHININIKTAEIMLKATFGNQKVVLAIKSNES